MAAQVRQLAIVTGASSGIGYELAKHCAENGFDLLIAAGNQEIERAATFRQSGASVDAVQADLSGTEGVEKLYHAIGTRRVHALLANAGRGSGRGFLDQDPVAWRKVVDTNTTGTLLLQKVGRDMSSVGAGRILITGSIVGFLPGTYSYCVTNTVSQTIKIWYARRFALLDVGGWDGSSERRRQ